MKWLMMWNDSRTAHCSDMAQALSVVGSYLCELGLAEHGELLAGELQDRCNVGSVMLAPHFPNPHVQSKNVHRAAMLYVKFAQKLDFTAIQAGSQVAETDDGQQFDRMLVTVLPTRPAERDIKVVQNVYRSMADNRILAVLANGTQQDVQHVVLAEGE